MSFGDIAKAGSSFWLLVWAAARKSMDDEVERSIGGLVVDFIVAIDAITVASVVVVEARLMS